MKGGAEPLALDLEVIERLIPHRRPLLLVDAVDAIRLGDAPALWARRRIAGDEEVFAGHFPGYAIWPGVYTIEGLGQTCLLLSVILGLVAAAEARGATAADVLGALRGAGPDRLAWPPPDPRAGLAGHIDVKLLAPVHGACELRYAAVLTHTLDRAARFEVDAEVDGRPVARGTIAGARGAPVEPQR